MKEQDTISSSQMALLFFSFMTGSSIINVPGPVLSYASNGAWISLMLSNLIGFALLFVLMGLHRQYPALNLVENGFKAIGRPLSVIVLIPFVLYLVLMFTWIVMGVGGFMISSMMRYTPDYMFHFLTFLSAAMTVRAGMEVMARMFVILTGIVVFFVVIVLVLSLGQYNPSYLLPILPEGIKPVLLGSYFTFGFPYAEVVVFSMLLPYVSSSSSRVSSHMHTALAINGILLVITTICSVMIYGPLASDLRYPIFSIARLIDFADFLQRVEAIVGISLITSSYMKASIALFALNLMVTRLCKVDDDRVFIFPITLACFFLSLVMFESEAEYHEKVNQFWPLVNLFGGVIPFLIIAVASIARRRSSS